MPATSSAPIFLAEGLSREYLLHHRVCPTGYASDGALLVAAAPDAFRDALDDLSVAYDCPVRAQRVLGDGIERLIERLTTRVERSIELARIDGAEDDLTADVRDLANQPPVIRYVNLLVRDATTPSSPALNCWPNWTSRSGAGRKTAGSGFGSKRASWTFGSPRCRQCSAKASSSACWTREGGP